MKNYERIKIAVQGSSLSSEDKFLLVDTFAEIADEYLGEIAKLFETKPEWIAFYNDNRKKKQEAFLSKDETKWAQICEEEKSMIDKLVFDSD